MHDPISGAQWSIWYACLGHRHDAMRGGFDVARSVTTRGHFEAAYAGAIRLKRAQPVFVDASGAWALAGRADVFDDLFVHWTTFEVLAMDPQSLVRASSPE